MFAGVIFDVTIPGIYNGHLIYGKKRLFCGALFKRSRLYALILPLNTRAKVKKALKAQVVGQTILYAKNDIRGVQRYVRAYFAGKKYWSSPTIDLDDISPFSLKVLRVVKKIPFGKTLDYAAIAKKAGSPKAVRAVGSILARNRLTLIVPCHRVIKKNGDLGNFSGGYGKALKGIMLLIEKNTCHNN